MPLLALTFAVLLLAVGTVASAESAAAYARVPRLVISEVHPNARAVGSTVEMHEWVELHNLESYRVNLGGWMIEDAQTFARLPQYDLEAGGAVVIVGSAARMRVPAGRTLIVLETAAIGNGLRNGGDRVALIDPYGVRRDAVSWGDVISPSSMNPPQAGQSIIRTRRGYQRLNRQPSPWRVDETINVPPERHRHARPDTQMQILSALVDPAGRQPETVTIRNHAAEPARVINWTLTAGASLARLPIVRIAPGADYTFTAAGGKFGAGLTRSGGRLILRDQHGVWLATASWGADASFHELPPAEPGAELHFNPLKRIHPRTPWYEALRDPPPLLVGRLADMQPRMNGNGQNIALKLERERAPLPDSPDTQQDDEAPPVWISEVYPNAGQGRNDAAYEWFELTNSSDQPLDLSGWTIADNTADDPLDGLILPPLTAVVVGVNRDAQAGLQPIIVDGRIGNGLANAGDQLRLINPAGLVVSAISWGDDRSYDTVRSPDNKQSVQRAAVRAEAQLGRPNPGAIPAANAATPAQPTPQSPQQSQPQTAQASPAAQAVDAPPDDPIPDSSETSAPPLSAVRITEVLPAPLSGQPEWVELFNPSDAPVDLSGWTIADQARRTELSGAIPAGGRITIATGPLDTDAPLLIVERIGNGLNNDADTIRLFDSQGREVDRLAYGREALPAPGAGLSLALDPARWVVTAQPSPGTDRVTPLLDDAFRAAAIREPISDAGRLPVVQAQTPDGVNAWMIVSFALIGVILTLALRRWQPPPTPAEQSNEGDSAEPPPEPSIYNGAAELPSAELELDQDRGERRQ